MEKVSLTPVCFFMLRKMMMNEEIRKKLEKVEIAISNLDRKIQQSEDIIEKLN